MGQPKIVIAIAGGGIAGLALAVGLYKNHPEIEFCVFEATKEYKDIGAGLAIHMNGINAMGLIHPDLRQAYFDKGLLMGEEGQEMSTEVIIAQGPYEGELVAQLGKAKNRKSVSRAELLQGFADLIPSHRIHFGNRLLSIEQHSEGVTLTFEGGSTYHADCLIAADGIHSPTRSYILGPDHPATKPVNNENWHVYRTSIPMSEALEQNVAERWTRVIPIMLGPAGYLNSMPLNKGTKLSASVCIRGVKFDENGNAPPLNPDDFKDYDEDARKIVELVAKDDLAWATIDHDPAPTYFHGRVAMIGDAAHATHSFNGQGAAQALEDVAVLNHLISRLSSRTQVEAMFEAFDTVRRPRSQRVVEISRKFGRIYSFAEGDLHKDPAEMKKVFAADAAYTNNADLVKQNDDAMQLFEKTLQNMSNGHANSR